MADYTNQTVRLHALSINSCPRAKKVFSLVSTATLSRLSDWFCAPLVSKAAKKYSDVLNTPDHFVEMLFLVEDKRFPIHFGVDPIAMIRALTFNFRGGTLQGGSTIGQQLYGIRRRRSGKLLARTVAYKLKQGAWSLCLSALTPKASILREYVDSVYWGRSYNGLDRAAEGYFSGARQSLSISQSFFLAERIATPNRVSIKRISNLLKRPPIRFNLWRNGATVEDVVATYENVYGCGGQMWQLLGK